ncbi:MAG TPA: hypothetical protein PLG25_15750 [bacterium]|nr:hypothetical protein [bacterium]HMZ05114.1 hypothetical protein [bacterium]HNE85326.1 hypothetical protein [bacterium]HNF85476.1 hypothetical protein [bacterium]HNH29718.1 hypothetical protein [bacterium]
MKNMVYLLFVMVFCVTDIRAQLPEGWYMAKDPQSLDPACPKDYAIGIDKGTKYNGKVSAFIESRNAQPEGAAILLQEASPADYKGKRIRISAFVNADNIQNWSGLFVSLDARGYKGLNDFMYDRPIKGTIEWKKQEVVIQIPVDAERIFYGVWLEGKGKIWVDDFVIEIVGEETPITAGRRILKRPRNLNLEE